MRFYLESAILFQTGEPRRLLEALAAAAGKSPAPRRAALWPTDEKGLPTPDDRSHYPAEKRKG